jgi:membrane protein implicated in regulation of membrane protease activity
MLNFSMNFEKEAIVDEEIRPHRKGRVHFQGTFWPARCLKNVTLTPGEICYVVNIDNITLFVEPATETESF